MTRMTALEAKNAFGQFLDAVQRSPVTVTKNGREVGAMFSMADLEKMAARLFPPLREAVERGEISLGEALVTQAKVDRRLEEAEADVAAGRVYEMDDGYFERLREEVLRVAPQRRG
ncbi:MAG: type II toxin-antitoxin system prevent-host-death family antitoxin [Gemmobacter sp.]